MKQITIDRFDGIYAICEDKDKAFSPLKRASCRRVQKAGDVLKITDDGALPSTWRRPSAAAHAF